MNKLCTKIILSGLLLASIPAQAQAWSQWFGSGLTSMKNSIVNASTETKVIAALTVAATAVGGYYLYRYLYPTDQELIDAANQAMNNSRGLLAIVPAHVLLAPVTEHSLRELYASYGYSDPNNALWALYGAQQELQKQHATLKARFDKRHKEKADVAVTEPLNQRIQAITTLRNGIDTCYTFMYTHQHYLRMLALQDSNNTKYSRAIAEKNNMQQLVPIIRRAQSGVQFPFIRFVKELEYAIAAIEEELRSAVPQGQGLDDLYTQKRGEVRNIQSDLETICATILGSELFDKEKTDKRAYEQKERELEIKRKEAEAKQRRAEAEEERARVDRERLRLEKEKARKEQTWASTLWVEIGY